MKSGGDKIEGEIDTILDKIVMLFSYLSDKVNVNPSLSKLPLPRIAAREELPW